jgi:PKD repeat protein
VKYFFPLFFVLLIAPNSFGQDFEWAVGISASIHVEDVYVDSNDFIYVTGRFFGTVDFDSGPLVYNLTSSGHSDIFVSKLDPDGNFLWAKKIGGIGEDKGYSITLDSDGAIFITGSFKNSVDFNPGAGSYNMTSFGSQDIFVLKLNSAGAFVWAKQFGGSQLDIGYSIEPTNDGNIVLIGIYSGIADFDPTGGVHNPVADGSANRFVLKLNSFGNLLWCAAFENSTYGEDGSGLEIDDSNNIYYVASFQGSMDFDPGPSSFYMLASSMSMFVLKLDEFGNFIWAKSLENGQSFGDDIKIDHAGDILITGFFTGTCDFDPTISLNNMTSLGFGDGFVAKYNSSGLLLWCKQFQGSGNDTPNSLDVDTALNIYITGHFDETSDFDPSSAVHNITAASMEDSYVVSLNSAGDFIWAIQFESTNAIYSNSICTKMDASKIVIAGSYIGTADLDPSLNDYNLVSSTVASFIQKMNYCHSPVYSNTSVVCCESQFIAPSGDEVYYVNGIYSDTIPSIEGCDSIISISLIFAQETTSSFSVTECTFYIAPSGDETFLYSGIFNDTITNLAGCDSIMTIDVTIIPPTTNFYNVATCNSFTVPSGDETYFVDGIYQDTIPNFFGCDSILTISLDILSSFNAIAVEACNSQSYTVPSGDETYYVTGIYYDTIPNTFGCDSIIAIDLAINPAGPGDTISACAYSYASPSQINLNSYLVDADPGGSWIKLTSGGEFNSSSAVLQTYNLPAGIYDFIYVVSGVFPCENDTAFYTLVANPRPNLMNTYNNQFCDDILYTFDPFQIDIPGTTLVWVLEGYGVGTGDIGTIPINLGYDHDQYMCLVVQMTSPDGCLNLDTTCMVVHPAPSVSFNSNMTWSCLSSLIDFTNTTIVTGDNCTWNFGDGNSSTGCGSVSHAYVTSGSYDVELVVTTIEGCSDSVTYTNYITVTSGISSSSSINISSCEYYVSPSSSYTWTSSGTYTDTLTNSAGCDSIITINLTIINSTSSSQNLSACDFIVSPSTNYTWTASGTYTDTLTNSAGCDSIITINLTINNPTSSAQNVSACDFMVSPSANYTWTSSGIYTDSLTSSAGCDSIITINLTINNPTVSSQNVSACDFMISPSGNYTWTTSGTYIDTIPNSNGCDSIMTINLTVNTVDNTVIQSGITLATAETGAAYQWLDCLNGYSEITGETNQEFTPIVNGEYAVVISVNGCADTSICFVIDEVGLESISKDMVRIFPNPGNGKFTVLLNSDYSENVFFTLSNSLGQTIYSGVLNDQENKLELNLADGIYYLKVTSGSNSQILELIIQQ